ncbi:hypothetical protein [Haliangium ochraceum]|uniref:Uncharacterized protein n=1 Tax=Haliangium ochraceum (strain DSM 14365 / JCM 11303 / SMP-2) TaxID=502025 RepID=D0LT63_HALO1|nr:hypothetical protein [Haliangium ochraceum]ACY19199.1 hypothetical protein Hoch_6735 [Haliangium ochraceum DSM 14365]
MKRKFCLAVLAAILLSSSSASAGVWFELLHAPCWTGDEGDIDANTGEYNGSVDCFNEDFNGGGARTVFTIKAFQAWEFGTVFLYYDVTGPFTRADEDVTDNEKGGFFGGTTITFSGQRIAQAISGAEEPMDLGPLADVQLKYEMEHVAKFGMLHYYGLQWDFIVPFLDFLSATTVIRDDFTLSGVDLQVGAAWQKSFSLASQDFIFGGFFQWGIFGEGEKVKEDFFVEEGNNFFLAQPQLLYDFGKLIQFTPAKLYIGLEYQLAFNRYLIEDKTENVLQGMIRWNI